MSDQRRTEAQKDSTLTQSEKRMAWTPEVGMAVSTTSDVLVENRGCSGIIRAVDHPEVLVRLDQRNENVWFNIAHVIPDTLRHDAFVALRRNEASQTNLGNGLTKHGPQCPMMFGGNWCDCVPGERGAEGERRSLEAQADDTRLLHAIANDMDRFLDGRLVREAANRLPNALREIAERLGRAAASRKGEP